MPEIRPAAIGGKRGENKSACGKACTAESQNRWLTTGQGFETFLSSGVRFSIEYRSEEHTSELQSHSDLVCRLLLEKKKNHIKHNEKSEPRPARPALRS